MLNRILLLHFIFSCAIVGAPAYEPPSYPQRATTLRAVTVFAPRRAQLGKSLSLAISLKPIKTLDNSRLFAYFEKDGRTWQVEILKPRCDLSKLPCGKTTQVGRYTIRLADNIPTGNYRIRVGLYGEAMEGEAWIHLKGKPRGRLPQMINCGEFKDKEGVLHRWHINRAHTMFWDGEPYLPVGGMFIYDRDWNLTRAQLDLLWRYGVKDIYLHLGVNQPYLWKEYSDDDYAYFQKTIDYMDELGMRYGIEFQALEAKGYGYPYPAGGPRIDNISGDGPMRAKEKGVRGGFFMVEDKATGKIVQFGEARVVDKDTLEADVKLPGKGDYRLIFLPNREQDGFTMYWWGGTYGKYRDRVLSHYSKIRLGKGFRFIVDPFWNEMNTNHGFIPDAPDYVDGFEKWLAARYESIDKLNKAWRVRKEGFKDFRSAASGLSMERIEEKASRRNYTYVYSRTEKKLFALDTATSQFNYDVRQYHGIALRDFCNRIANDIKTFANVPVIFKAFSDADWWHINDAPTSLPFHPGKTARRATGCPGGFDGLGMESYGNGEPMLMFMGAHIFGECEQYTKTSWLIVTETGEGNHQDASPSRNKGIGYSSRLGNMYANFNALISGGAKGIFQYNMMPGRGCQEPWTDAVSRDPRQLEWLATYRRILENAPRLIDYKPPVYYRFPALFNPNSMELYSEPNGDFYNMGGWWWREPVERAPNDIWILPSFSLRPDSPMFIVNLENKPASERFRMELEQAIRDGVRITMIGFRKDLGTIPVVDRYYTGRYSACEDGRRFQVLRPSKTSRILGKNRKGEVWNLIDGNIQIQSKEVFGKHGYRPEFLLTGRERPIEAYYGVFQMLGVKIHEIGDGYEAFSFREGERIITLISKTKGPEGPLPFALPAGTKCYRPGGTEPTSDLLLAPADLKLVRAHYDWAPEGIMCDTLDARDTLIIESPNALSLLHRPRMRPAPLVAWVEAESRPSDDPSVGRYGCLANNFNYGRLGGMLNLSSGGMLALETAVPPPKDTGWYATYRFLVGSPGEAELWVRESYLAMSSPSEFKIDDGPWVEVPNTLVARDARVVTFYNPVEDTRQIFAWYHYANVRLTSGSHTITFRVTRPRPKGCVITMADDRPYAKMIDCLAFFPRDFKPDGTGGEVAESFSEPLYNLIEDPSIEFDTDGDGKPDGWSPISGGKEGQAELLQWTKTEWGNFKVDGLVDINLGRRESYCGQRALRIEAGSEDNCWSYKPTPVKPKAVYQLEGWIRRPDQATRAGFRLKWLDAAGKVIEQTIGQPPDLRDWAFYWLQAIAPEQASSAVIECCVSPSAGIAWFDDIVFMMLAPSVESLRQRMR